MSTNPPIAYANYFSWLFPFQDTAINDFTQNQSSGRFEAHGTLFYLKKSLLKFEPWIFVWQ